jgi:membrane protein implicated in regulation of membrane protease activity
MEISVIVALSIVALVLAAIIYNFIRNRKNEPSKPTTHGGGGGGSSEVPVVGPKDEPAIDDEEVNQEEVEQ